MLDKESIDSEREVQFIKSASGFILLADYSRIKVFVIAEFLAMVIFMIWFIIIDQSYKPEFFETILWLFSVSVLIWSIIYFAMARQVVKLEYPTLQIGVSLGNFTYFSQTVDYRRVQAIHHKHIDFADFGSIILELKNDLGVVDLDQQVEFGNFLTVSRCKLMAWHLNNYFRGVA